jgi:hypothetical protein
MASGWIGRMREIADEELQELAARGEIIAYFGYGSLVNRATHRTEIVAARPCRLKGWRRFWRPRPDMPFNPAQATPVSLLTVRRVADSWIDGLLVFDRAENLPSLDEREAHYERRLVPPTDIELRTGKLPDGCEIFVYEAREGLPDHDGNACPILQSYLDAVLQGFLAEHGEAGLSRFVLETDGFETAVLADRHAPVYPRAVVLTVSERALIDTLLAERNVRYTAA